MPHNKSDKNAYAAVHMWVRYHHGRPKRCDNCGTTADRMYHWANISGTYKRERSDWLRLCVPCHKQNDIKALGGKIRARPVKVQPIKLCAECGVEFSKNPKLSKSQWETTFYCSKACSTRVTGRKLQGTQQTIETKALKSQLLRERWANNEEWRERVTNKMIGNQHARKKPQST